MQSQIPSSHWLIEMHMQNPRLNYTNCLLFFSSQHNDRNEQVVEKKKESKQAQKCTIRVIWMQSLRDSRLHMQSAIGGFTQIIDWFLAPN